jgi:hypothetical protein
MRAPEVGRSSPSSVVVKNEWSYSSAVRIHRLCFGGDTFTFIFNFISRNTVGGCLRFFSLKSVLKMLNMAFGFET